MKKVTLILGLILGLFLLNSSKPYTSDDNTPKTRLDSLKGKKWGRERGVEIYKKDTMLTIYTFSSGADTLRYVYYLTDDISKIGIIPEEMESNFDWSKVGKSVKGKYIVKLNIPKNPGNNDYRFCDICEILELTENKLVLLRVHSTGESAAIPDLVYRAEPLNE